MNHARTLMAEITLAAGVNTIATEKEMRQKARRSLLRGMNFVIRFWKPALGRQPCQVEPRNWTPLSIFAWRSSE